eukprot:1480444-Karenia_brevis.AAC.1
MNSSGVGVGVAWCRGSRRRSKLDWSIHFLNPSISALALSSFQQSLHAPSLRPLSSHPHCQLHQTPVWAQYVIRRPDVHCIGYPASTL